MQSVSSALVTKSECDRYDIRKDGNWAVIMIAEKGGVLSIQSSFGNWAYYWPSHGRPSFRHFLIELERDTDYLLNKLCGGQNHVNGEESIKRTKAQIVRMRRDGAHVYVGVKLERLTKEMAREAYDNLEAVGGVHSSVDAMIHDILDAAPWLDIHDLDIKNEYDPQAVRFVETLWPMFVATIKNELAPKPAGRWSIGNGSEEAEPGLILIVDSEKHTFAARSSVMALPLVDELVRAANVGHMILPAACDIALWRGEEEWARTEQNFKELRTRVNKLRDSLKALGVLV